MRCAKKELKTYLIGIIYNIINMDPWVKGKCIKQIYSETWNK